ncbi:MAG TPA: glycosyltransferase [Ignavibacteriaceae bacterium]
MDKVVFDQHKIPLISVLITSYNVSEYVPYSISSIISQTYQNFEIIYIDDGSEDNTNEIVNSFNSGKIFYFKTTHTGRTKALNYGLTLCKGDLIAIMDADDIALPIRLEKQVNFMISNPDIHVLSCYYAVFKNNHIEYIVKNPVNHENIIQFLLLHSCICHGGALIRKSVYNEFTGYREVDSRDYEFWLRIKDKVYFHNLPEVLMLVRYNPNSLTKKNVSKTNVQTYIIQTEYFNKLTVNCFIQKLKIRKLKGWREFFYGDRKKARIFFRKFLFTETKATIAYFLTYLPLSLFEYLKEQRIRYRLEYIFTESKNLKTSLDDFLQKIHSEFFKNFFEN